MEKYSKILIYIFLLVILNLFLSSYLLFKINIKPKEAKVETSNTPKASYIPTSTAKPMVSDDIRADLTLIKAEIRSIREILGITGSFEELSNLIQTINQTDKTQ